MILKKIYNLASFFKEKYNINKKLYKNFFQ